MSQQWVFVPFLLWKYGPKTYSRSLLISYIYTYESYDSAASRNFSMQNLQLLGNVLRFISGIFSSHFDSESAKLRVGPNKSRFLEVLLFFLSLLKGSFFLSKAVCFRELTFKWILIHVDINTQLMSFMQSCLERQSLELKWLERQTVQVEKKRAEALSPGSTSFSLKLLQKGLTVDLTSSGKTGKKLLSFAAVSTKLSSKNHCHPRYPDPSMGDPAIWRTPPNLFFSGSNPSIGGWSCDP